MKTLDIVFSPSDKVTVRPVPRSLLPVLEKLMIELQSIWIAEEFSTGDAISRDDCWALIERVWVMLPIAETPKATLSAESLESISHDYEQLERLFFGDASKAWDSNYQVSINELDENAPVRPYNGSLVTPKYVDLAWMAVTGQMDVQAFAGCAVWELHRVDARKKLIAADELRREKPQNEPSPPPMSQSPAVETAPPTPSLTSSTGLVKRDSPYSSDSMPTPSTG